MAFENLDAFNKGFRRVIRQRTEEEFLKIHKAVHMTVLAEAITSTPVDTGHAARNWDSSTGEPGTAVRGGPGGESAADPDADRERAKQEAIERAVAILSGLQPFSTSYVFNNVKYITYLNDGTDKMPAAAMAEKAIQAAADELSNLVPGVTG